MTTTGPCEPAYADEAVTVYCGDVREVLSQLPSESVQCVMTSPPYWGLRDYKLVPQVWGGDTACAHHWKREDIGHGSFCRCGAWRGDLGLEPTPELYVEHIVEVFREVRRVLRKDGTLWLNLGDTYTSTAQGTFNAPERIAGGAERRSAANVARARYRPFTGLKPKDLVGMPWRVAVALQQPYERHVISAATDRAWMAGLVDGEGCVSCVAVAPRTGLNESHSMRLQIRMADAEAVERVVAIAGLSTVTYDLDTGQGARPAQQWKVSGDKAADALADLYPFLTVKRKQAIVGWNIQRLKDGVVTKRGVPIPAENMAKRRLLHDLLHDLNQRRPVDLPNWLRAPEVYREDGWYLRSDVIWSKPNPMPSSARDRPTVAHEHVFLLARSARYYYNADAVSTPIRRGPQFGDERRSPAATPPGAPPHRQAQRLKMPAGWATHEGSHGHYHRDGRENGKQQAIASASTGASQRTMAGFNKRYKNASQPAQDAQRRLVENVKAARRAGGDHDQPLNLAGANLRSVWQIASQPYPDAHFATFPEELARIPILAGSRPRDVVLDPFAGSGTTLAVAKSLDRQAIGIELNPEYVRLISRRCEQATAQPELFAAAALEALDA